MYVDIHSLMHDAKDVDFVFIEDVEDDVASTKHAAHTRLEIAAWSPRTRPAPQHLEATSQLVEVLATEFWSPLSARLARN